MKLISLKLSDNMEEKKGIYFIVNSVDERRTKISGFFETLDEAKEALEKCADWFCSKGTGEIYFQEFGISKRRELVIKK